MLDSDKSRGYCLEMICADFLAGANLDNQNPETLLFSLNFAVPNLLLAGLVDSGEAFFLMALVGILSASGSFSSLSPPYWGRS